MISVVIPTIKGREDHYARCVEAYRTRTVAELQIITIRDAPTCGVAWNEGAAQATGDYLHFTADDLEPHRGWDVAAAGAVERGWYPAARVDQPDGSTQWWGSDRLPVADGGWVRAGWVPFMPIGLWTAIGPSLDTHYGTDDWLSWKAGRAGWPNVYTAGYAFTHYTAAAGRGAGMTERQRRTADARVLAEAMRREETRQPITAIREVVTA